MLTGVSTRTYADVLEPVGAEVGAASSSISRSAVSRRFIQATKERLEYFRSRPLNDRRWLVVYIDGLGFAGVRAEVPCGSQRCWRSSIAKPASNPRRTGSGFLFEAWTYWIERPMTSSTGQPRLRVRITSRRNRSLRCWPRAEQVIAAPCTSSKRSNVHRQLRSTAHSGRSLTSRRRGLRRRPDRLPRR